MLLTFSRIEILVRHVQFVHNLEISIDSDNKIKDHDKSSLLKRKKHASTAAMSKNVQDLLLS